VYVAGVVAARVSPTTEQVEAVTAFASGQRLAVEALAGTGKTTTLTMMAKERPKTAVYVAFNKAIVNDAKGKFGSHVDCRTAHSLGFRAVGKDFKSRLDAPRLKPRDIMNVLGCEKARVTLGPGRRLDPEGVASHAWRTALCFSKSTDFELTEDHVPRPPGISDEAFRLLAETVLPFAAAAWADLSQVNGRLKFDHDVYLKLWQLSGPKIAADYILFDEAQDADPVMLDIVQSQSHAQQVFVGDRFQAIYEWRGAINAMEAVEVEQRAWLTQSFRFGGAVAEEANKFLRLLKATQTVVGNPGRDSSVGLIRRPTTILTRTNSHAVAHVIDALDRGGRPALVGGAQEVVKFAEAAETLMAGQPTVHPQLACFAGWEEVREFVQSASQQEVGEMAMLVRLVDSFGARRLAAILRKCVEEDRATVVISTAHKAKGREWSAVKIGADFQAVEEMSPEELRLAYVAVTRAIDRLDVSDFGNDSGGLLDEIVKRVAGPTASVPKEPRRPKYSGGPPPKVGYRSPGAAPSRQQRPSPTTAGSITPDEALAELARRARPKGARPRAASDRAFRASTAELRAIAAQGGAGRSVAKPTTPKPPPARVAPSQRAPAPTSQTPPAKKGWFRRVFGG
jgi:hypothetical protein